MVTKANLKKFFGILVVFIIMVTVMSDVVKTTSIAATKYYLKTANKSGTFSKEISTHTTLTAAMEAMNKSSDSNAVVVKDTNNTVAAMKKGIAISAGYLDGGKATVSFLDNVAGSQQYIDNNNGMFYFKTESEARVQVGIGGIKNFLPLKQLRLIPDAFLEGNATGDFKSKYPVDYYARNSAGDLVHYISSFTEGELGKQFDSKEKITLYAYAFDKAPSFMKTGQKYYSLNGDVYYSDRYLKNKAGTFYPYFRNLSFRSKTKYTAADLNKYIKRMNGIASPTGTKSVLLNKGNAFIKAQDKNGINALLELAFACLESGYGKSNYAVNRFNLFGINAVDSDPGRATYFKSVADCVHQHSRLWLSKNYFDAGANIDNTLPKSLYMYDGTDYRTKIGDWRYYGTNIGNKATGINVKYCSSPWQGEKIASIAYSADKFLGSKDYGAIAIGVTKKATDVYRNANTKSWKLYNISGTTGIAPTGIPINVLESSGDYYRIRTEIPVVKPKNTTKRVAIPFKVYDFAMSRGYVLKSNLKIISGKKKIKTRNPSVKSNRKFKKTLKVKIVAPKYATVYYTTNGKKPTTKSKKILPLKSKTIKFTKTRTLRVITMSKGFGNSSQIKRVYTKTK